MANKYAIANGNFNNASIWSLSATGLSATTVPTLGDNAWANSFVVTITGDISCDTLNNGVSGLALAGGYFLVDTSSYSANISATIGWSCTEYTNVMVLSGSNNITITGNIYGGANLTSTISSTPVGVNSYCTNNTVTVKGNIYSGSPVYTYGYANGFIVNTVSNSVYNITGTLQSYNRSSQYGSGSTVLRNLGPSTINWLGDVVYANGNTGGDSVLYSNNGTINHIGIVNGVSNSVGGSPIRISGGVYNLTTPTLFANVSITSIGDYPLISNEGGVVNIVTGTIQGGPAGGNFAHQGIGTTSGVTQIIASNILAGTKLQAIYANGGTTRIVCPNIYTSVASVNAITSPGGSLLISGNILNDSSGTQAIYAASYRLDPIPINGYIRYARSGTGIGANAWLYQYTTDSLSAFSMPPVSSVRLGTTFANGTLTGTCAIPSPSSVSIGTLVDNSTGSAIITVDSILNMFNTPLSTFDTPNTIGSKIKYAATTESTGHLIASFTNG